MSKNEYDLGIEANYFFIYGIAEYARALENREYFELAIQVFNEVYKKY